MIDAETLEAYRRMTPSERIAIGVGLTRIAWAMLDVPTREAGDRKWALWSAQHAAGQEAIVAALHRDGD